MFDFNEYKLTEEQVIEIAKQDGLPPLRVAINANGYRHVQHIWQPNLKTYEGEHASRLPYHLRYREEEVEKAVDFYRKAKSLLSGE